MLTEAKAEQIEQLLREGRLSQRGIARQMGVCRATVGSIKSGRWRPRRRPDAIAWPSGPVVRCGGCGGRVYAPCLLCQVRALER